MSTIDSRSVDVSGLQANTVGDGLKVRLPPPVNPILWPGEGPLRGKRGLLDSSKPSALSRVGLLYWAREVCIACQMPWLVAGTSRCLTPSGAGAFRTALTTAGSAPTVPTFPALLAPSGVELGRGGVALDLMAPGRQARCNAP